MLRSVRVFGHDEILFSRAVDAARSGEHHRVRVGAVLAKGHRTLETAHNRTRVVVDNPFKKGHAEVQVVNWVTAIKCTLYVARLDLNDELAPSWPCDDCMDRIRACGCVTKICYFDGVALLKVRI